MDLTYDAYYHLYNTNDGERNKIFNLNLIASRFYDDDDIDNENFFNYDEVENVNNNLIIDDEDEDEIKIYNGNNELVKIFIAEKCIICLENDSIYAFRNCGHVSICESCYKNKCYLQILKIMYNENYFN